MNVGNSSIEERIGRHLLASYLLVRYGVGLLLILSSRYSYDLQFKNKFSAPRFLFVQTQYTYHYRGADSLNFYFMKRASYISPTLTRITVVVELGFSFSTGIGSWDDRDTIEDGI